MEKYSKTQEDELRRLCEQGREEVRQGKRFRIGPYREVTLSDGKVLLIPKDLFLKFEEPRKYSLLANEIKNKNAHKQVSSEKEEINFPMIARHSNRLQCEKFEKANKFQSLICRMVVENAVREAVSKLKSNQVPNHPVVKQEKYIEDETYEVNVKRQFNNSFCTRVKIKVDNYFEAHVMPNNVDSEMYIEKVTNELYSFIFVPCTGCIIHPNSNCFGKNEGNLIMLGIDHDDISSIERVLRKDDYFKQYFVTNNEELLPTFFEKFSTLLPDSCRYGNVFVANFVDAVKEILFNEMCKAKITKKEYIGIFDNLGFSSNINIGSHPDIWMKCKPREAKADEGFSYAKNLVDYLYRISGGSFTNLSKFARMLAEIFMGKNYNKNSFVVLRTCNKSFVKSFLRDIFRFNTNMNLDIDKVNDLDDYKLSNSNPDFKLRRDGNTCYHYTEYSVAQLSDKDNLPRFYTDVYNGHLVNVTDLVGFNEDKVEQLKKLSDRNSISYNHKIFGQSSFRPQGMYIFVTDNDSQIPFDEYKIDYTIVDLGREHMLETYEGMTTYEKAILVSKLVVWGYRQLMDSKIIGSNAEDSIDYKKYFMDHCVNEVEYSESALKNKEPGIEYSVQLATINGAWRAFMKGCGDTSKFKFKSEDFANAIMGFSSYILSEYYMSCGYGEGDVLKKGSNSYVVFGWTVKSKDDVIAEGAKLKKSLEEKSDKLTLNNFIAKLDKQCLSIKLADLL